MASAASTDPKWHTVLCDSESDQGVFKISLLEPLQALKTQARVCRTTRQHVQRLYLLGLLSCNHAKIGLQDSWQYELTTMPSVIRRFWRKAHSSSVNQYCIDPCRLSECLWNPSEGHPVPCCVPYGMPADVPSRDRRHLVVQFASQPTCLSEKLHKTIQASICKQALSPLFAVYSGSAQRLPWRNKNAHEHSLQQCNS